MHGLSQRNLQQFILWKIAPSRMLVLQIRKLMQVWRKVLQVDEQLSKRSEKNGVKSAVAVLKLGDWYESLVINQGGCVFQDVKPPKSILRKSTEHAESNPTFEIHEVYCTSHWIHLPRWTSSAQPRRSKIWGSVSRRDGRSWPKISLLVKEKNKTALFSPLRICDCLRHQPFNQRTENLFWTLERPRTRLAKRIWTPLIWRVVRKKDSSVDPISLSGEFTVSLLILVEVEGQQELREIEDEWGDEEVGWNGELTVEEWRSLHAWMRWVQTRAQLEPRDVVCNEWRWRHHELTRRLRAHSLVRCRVSCPLCWSWLSRRHWCRTPCRSVSPRIRNSKFSSCRSPTLFCHRQFTL